MTDCPPFFSYGQKELAHLSARDKKLAQVIEETGFIKRAIYPDPFAGLLRAIIGQQISGKAQESIWARFCALGCSTPQAVLNLAVDDLRACGISARKAECIRTVAIRFASGALSEPELAAMEDAHLLERLVSLRGIGPWTAHRLLIFTFHRKNVLSHGDLGIQRGLCALHHHRALTPQLCNRYHRLYTPYATIASFYLWELAGKAKKTGRAPAKSRA